MGITRPPAGPAFSEPDNERDTMKRNLTLGALAAALLLSAAAFAIAAPSTATYNGAGSVSGSVAVTATVSPKLTMTIDTPDDAQTVDFGIVDPGSLVTRPAVNVAVQSNKAFGLTVGTSGDVAALDFQTTALAAGGAAGVTNFSDTYSVNVPWSTAPGVYHTTVQYTAAQ